MGHVLAICGGVGGAKLAVGLARVLAPEDLTIVVNTGDDFEHLGLHISPDIDTVLYTLSGRADPERGWGLKDETWAFMGAIGELAGPAWFNLGDKDLATHVLRTEQLRIGRSLSDITAGLARRMDVAHRIAPMSDDPVRTWLTTDQGDLPFQQYFVKYRCAPRLSAVRFEGAGSARPSAAFEETMRREDLDCVLICPSNPYLSVDPVLAVPGVRQALGCCRAPRIAVSPLVGGKAVKGPTAKIMEELGLSPTSVTIAGHYHGLLDGLVLDTSDAADAPSVEASGPSVLVAPTLMNDLTDKLNLARACLDFALALKAADKGGRS